MTIKVFPAEAYAERCFWCVEGGRVFYDDEEGDAFRRLKCICGKHFTTHGSWHPHPRLDMDKRGKPVTCEGFELAPTANNERLLQLGLQGEGG